MRFLLFFLFRLEEQEKFVEKRSSADFLVAPISAKLSLQKTSPTMIYPPPLPTEKNILLSDSRIWPLTNPPCHAMHACVIIQAHHHRHDRATYSSVSNTMLLFQQHLVLETTSLSITRHDIVLDCHTAADVPM